MAETVNAASTPTTGAKLGQLKRSALLHFLANPNASGDPSKDTYLIGQNVEDMSVELNPDTESVKNILDETVVNDNGYEPTVDVDTYYANPSDGWIYDWLKDIAMNRKTGDDCLTQMFEVLIDKKEAPFDCWNEEVIVKPTSYGGAQGGVSIPFTITPCGNREQGTATLTGKKLASYTPN